MADLNNEQALKMEKEEKESPMEVNDQGGKEEKSEETKEEKEESGDENEAQDESESEEEEELPPGLLEQPLEIQGKREKKKVERLSAAMVPQSTKKKKVEIEEGSGIKLGEISFIEDKLNATKAIDLKPLHRLLFLCFGAQNEVKRNIRQFCGFTHSKDSKEIEKRTTMMTKMNIPELKSMCLTLGLERSGAKKDVIDRIIDFLMSPNDKGMKVPKSKKTKRASKSSNKKKKDKGTKRKRSPKKKVKKAKSEDTEEEEVDKDLESLDDDDGDDDEQVSEEEEESEEEAPKKKKAKLEPKKKPSEKVNGKKKAPKKKEVKKPSPKKKKDDDLSDSSDSNDEPIANMMKSPPSNDEIKELVKKILDGADLESVTMKTVVKEVYSKYPRFDLSDRKDFIKSTVREVIS